MSKKKKKCAKKSVKIRIGRGSAKVASSPKKKEKKEKVEYSPATKSGKIISQGVDVDSLFGHCNHPYQAKVGKHEIVIISWRDFEFDKHAKLIENLDIFIGLCGGYDKYELFKKEYKNLLLQDVSKRFHKKENKLENMIVLEIRDGGYSERVFEIARDLLNEGKLIGFGCMGAHGRTGWLYARLIKHYEEVSGDVAVRRARERFCNNMVETKEQTKQLGCKKEIGSYERRAFEKAVTLPYGAPIVGTSRFTSLREEELSKPAWLQDMDLDGAADSASGLGSERKPMRMEESVEDEENPDQVVKTTPEQIVITNALHEAYQKEREGLSLTEEEERLIEEDLFRLINESEDLD